MCLGIPGQIVEITDPARQMALAEILGVGREVRLTGIADGPLEGLIGAAPDAPVRIMEICGRGGGWAHPCDLPLRARPADAGGIEFVHGPGWPVCLLPRSRVDACVEIAETPGGYLRDLRRRDAGARNAQVADPGQGRERGYPHGLLAARRAGARPAHRDREAVFFGLGFETTTPSRALSIRQAARRGLVNFSVFCNRITVPPSIRALLADPGQRLDGFDGGGHVSMVIGAPLPLRAEVKGACEILGLDPLSLANEGRLVVFVAEAVVAAMRPVSEGAGACAVGRAVAAHPGTVAMRTLFGGSRIVGGRWASSFRGPADAAPYTPGSSTPKRGST